MNVITEKAGQEIAKRMVHTPVLDASKKIIGSITNAKYVDGRIEYQAQLYHHDVIRGATFDKASFRFSYDGAETVNHQIQNKCTCVECKDECA